MTTAPRTEPPPAEVLPARRALEHRTPPPVATDDWWQDTIAHLRTLSPVLGAGAVTAFVITAAAVLAWLLISALWAVLSALTGVLAGATLDVAGSAIIRTITDPVRVYLETHATVLPATAQQLWGAWLGVTGALFLLAAAGFLAARLGWVILGGLTVAMVYAATPAPGQALAAGVTIVVWALLSLIALYARRIRPAEKNEPPAPGEPGGRRPVVR